MVAAVIEDGKGQVFLARRPDHLHQGGLWEFPGGKLESGETVLDGLRRELNEELGIEVLRAAPLIRVRHAYPDRKVLLDVWRVTAFSGSPHGREGQEVAWVAREALPKRAFPAANGPIVTAARLPRHYLITPEPGPESEWDAFLERLEQRLRAGIRLVQLRAKELDTRQLERLAVKVVELVNANQGRVLLNASAELVLRTGASGLHLSSAVLSKTRSRPISKEHWLACSCHSLAELRQAEAIGADFAVLSPINATKSHPGATVLGWAGFSELCEQTRLPLYALGGMALGDLARAQRAGAQGIAAIRALWDSGDTPILEGDPC